MHFLSGSLLARVRIVDVLPTALLRMSQEEKNVTVALFCELLCDMFRKDR